VFDRDRKIGLLGSGTVVGDIEAFPDERIDVG
jgi:hypothetical protein